METKLHMVGVQKFGQAVEQYTTNACPILYTTPSLYAKCTAPTPGGVAVNTEEVPAFSDKPCTRLCHDDSVINKGKSSYLKCF